MVVGILAIILGLWACGSLIFQPARFARRRSEDRAMPWIGNPRLHGWTEKALAALPLPLARAVYLVLGLMIIAGGVVDLTSR